VEEKGLWKDMEKSLGNPRREKKKVCRGRAKKENGKGRRGFLYWEVNRMSHYWSPPPNENDHTQPPFLETNKGKKRPSPGPHTGSEDTKSERKETELTQKKPRKSR